MVNKVSTDPLFSHARALLLVRHGTLVGEHYFNGAGPNDLNDLRSVTKSVLSMTMGIAVDRGEVPPVTALLRHLLPQYAHHLDGRPQTSLNLEHLLTMQAGLQWDDSSDPWLGQLFAAHDLVDYALSQPTVAAPGTQFEYSSALSQVLSKVLVTRTQTTLHQYVRQHLFAPLGIQHSDWLVRPSGDHYGGLGMRIKPRDMARLGQLAAQRGYWSGRQVVPMAWMDRSIRDFRGSPYGYGYQWWRLGSERFTAIGYGGQYVDVDRANDTLICLVVNWNVPASTHLGLGSFDQLRDLLMQGLRTEAHSAVAAIDSDGTALSSLEVLEPQTPQLLTVALERTGSHDGALAVRVDTRNGSARSYRDFVPVSQMERWEHGDASTRLVNVTLLPDQVDEGTERFFLDVVRLTGNGSVDTPTIEINITDRAVEPSTLHWTAANVTATEGGSATIELVRSGNLDQPLTVPYSVQHVTTTAADLVGGESSASTAFVFDPQQTVAQLSLAFHLDSEPEPTEILQVVLHTEGLELDQVPMPASAAVVDSAPAGCETEAEQASCFLNQRYKAEVVWQAPTFGTQGRGEFASLIGFEDLPGAQSAQVTFFNPANVELLLKVLDGQAINGSAWVFFGKLSDLPVWLVIRDLDTGHAALWHSPDKSICGVADIGSLPSGAGMRASSGVDTSGWSERLSGAGHAILGGEVPPHSGGSESAADARDCPDDALCLHDRFEIKLRWELEDQTATAVPVPNSAESGAFWIFNPGNVEVGVKILDGRGINGHYWFFSGALTDLDYTIEVWDRSTGTLHQFENRAGDLCGFAEIAQLSSGE